MMEPIVELEPGVAEADLLHKPNGYGIHQSSGGEVDLGLQPLTDPGHAQRLVDVHGHDMYWVPEKKHWVIWDGTRWVKNNTGCLERWCLETLRSAHVYFNDRESREALLRAENRTKKILEAARSVEAMAKEAKEFDTNIHLLNLPNGTWNHIIGELQPHSRDDCITVICPTPYNPDANCDRWLKFLNEAHSDDGQIVSYLQEIVGYLFTGDVRERSIICLFGPTTTGKTTFLTVLRKVIGDDYSGQVRIESLMSNAKQSNNNSLADVADIEGKYFVTTSEAEVDHKISEGLCKELTQGPGTTMKVSRKYQNPYPILITAKVVMDANHRPKIRGSDDAIWKRFKNSIPWMVRVSEDRVNKHLVEQLIEEKEGILAWALEGHQHYRERGNFAIPDAIDVEWDTWRTDNNPLGPFMDQEMIIDPGDHNLWVSSANLRSAMERWWDENTGGRHFMPSPNTIAVRLQEQGCESTKRNGVRGWRFCQLKSGNQYPLSASGKRLEQGNIPPWKLFKQVDTRDTMDTYFYISVQMRT